MRKPVATSLAVLGLISAGALSSSAQQLRPAMSGDNASTASTTTTPVKKPRRHLIPGLSGTDIFPHVKPLGDGQDATSNGQSIFPPNGGSLGSGASVGSGTSVGAGSVGSGVSTGAGLTTNQNANPVSGNVMFNSSGNSTLGGATDILLNTQGGEPTPKTPLATIAPQQIAVSIEPAQVALNDLRGIQIIVKNNTDRPVVINGDMASITLGGQCLKAASLGRVDVATCPPVTPKEQRRRFIEAAVTVGAIPTIEDQKIQNGPILARYGCDESRRINEISQFNRRVLWPGDSTGGVLYFQTSQSLKGATIQLPINTLFVNTDGALLTILP